MLDTTPLSEENSYHYNDYFFYERITSGGGTNMLGYNDAKNILIFYGIYTSGANYETMTQYIDHSDWEGFFKAFYPEYDFANER